MLGPKPAVVVGAPPVVIYNPVARIEVVAIVIQRHRRRRIVVKDEGLPGVSGEVNYHVGPHGRHEKKRLSGYVSVGRTRRLYSKSTGCGGDYCHLREKPALIGDLNPGGTLGGRIGHPAQTAVLRPGRIRRIHGGRHQLDFRWGRRVSQKEREVEDRSSQAFSIRKRTAVGGNVTYG